MRKLNGLLLTAGLICGAHGTAQAQTNEGLFPRLRTMFAPRSKAEDAKIKADEATKEVRPTAPASKRIVPAAPKESRGVVYVDAPSRVVAAPSVTSSPTIKTSPSKTAPPPIVTQTASTPGTTSTPIVNAPVAESKTPPPTSPALAQKFARQVSQACPQARNVRVTFTGGNEVTVEMGVRAVEDCNVIAGQIFAIRDLDPYRVNLKFQVPQ